MKLLRYGPNGQEKPGLLDSKGQIRDLSGHILDIDGSILSNLASLNDISISDLPVISSDIRFGGCVYGVGKLICIGLNYSDHAAETGLKVPSEPVIFMKATSAICGANDNVPLPKNSKKTDWEVELGVVIGKKAKYVSVEQASKHIAGFCIVNDYSEREFQDERQGQWTKGKSCDNFAPIGPYLVTPDEVAKPQNLAMWLDVNGMRRQNGNSSKMVYKIEYLISYLSQFMSLHPGDIISTGTPPGVGKGMKPPSYLKVGDEVSLGIEGLGEQRQRIIADR